MSLRRISGLTLCLMVLFVMGCGSGSDSAQESGTAGNGVVDATDDGTGAPELGDMTCWVEAVMGTPIGSMDGLPEQVVPGTSGDDNASGTSTFNPGDGTAPPPLEGRIRIAGMDDDLAELATHAYEIAIRGDAAPAITDDTLTVTLSRSGGCKRHDFTLVASRDFMAGATAADPVELDFTIVHNNHGDLCEAYLTDRVAFDLTTIKNRYQAAYPTGDGAVFLAFQPPDGSACGYDGIEYDAAAGSSQAQAIKIGFIVAGERPTYLRSAQLAVDEMNAEGGLFGKSVELVNLVNRSASLPLSIQTAENMILNDGVVAIIGPNRSTHAVGVGPLAQRYGVPMVTTAASNPRVTEAGDYVFMASVTDTFQGRVMAQFARQDLAVQRVALLTLSGDVYTEGIAEFFAANFETLGGSVVVEAFYDDGATDFTEQLTRIADTRPEAFFISGFNQDIGPITRQARAIPMRNAAGEPTLFLGTDTWDSEILLADEEAELEGSFFTTHFSPDTDEPAAQAFIEAYQTAYNAVPTGGDAVNYDAVQLLFDAIERAHSLDPEAIREQLQATENYAGATHIAGYDANRHPAKSAVILTIEDGEKKFHRQIDPPLRGAVVINDAGEPWESDPYALQAATITGDTLTITAAYGGGCRTHHFTLVAAAAFMESDPVQLRVSLHHDANDDLCKAYLMEAYDFDLTPIKTRYQDSYGARAGTIILRLDNAPDAADLVYQFAS